MTTKTDPKRRWRWRIAGVVALVLIGFVAVLLHGSAHGLTRQSWPVPASTVVYTTWADVFAHAPKVTLHSLDTGAVHVPRPTMLAKSHPLAATYVDEKTPLRVYAHLIRHPTRGDFLIDSGLDATFAQHRYGNIAAPAWWLVDLIMHAPYSQAAGEDVMAQLRALESKPQAVFLTHLHFDHTAGLPALGNSVAVVTGPNEADDPPARLDYGHFKGRTKIYELDFAGAPAMPDLGVALDLFGDGSVWAVHTRGHSRGHLSFVVNATSGPILLVGDASHFQWAFRHGVGPMGTSGDPDAVAQSSLDRLRTFATANPTVAVFTGHESPAKN